MSRASTLLLLLGVLFAASSIEGAVLLRFINTVPTRSASTRTATSDTHLTDPDPNVDRVGLQYFSSSGSALNSPTLVWTEIMNNQATAINSAKSVAPFAWIYAMPPLRSYGNSRKGKAVTDKVADIDAVTGASGDARGDASVVDTYDQSLLKGDGVSLYLSFAAGTYKMQAFGVLGGGAPDVYGNLPKSFTGSLTTFTFADNNVYTLIAVGDGKFNSAIPTDGNTVVLKLLQESVAPTTFGKASLRYFHAISTQSSTGIDIYRGQNPTTSDILAKNLAFGAVSSYVDVAPSVAQVVSITPTGSTTVLAPSSSGSSEVTADIRAGLRATVICAIYDSATATIFCRMIPSRVVAYVRFVNDLAGQASLVQGAFGSTTLSQTQLSLWASYEFPNPIAVTDWAQSTGNRKSGNHPGLVRGLYQVLSKINANDVTGYGEVFVPLPIMDFALRYTVVFDYQKDLDTAMGNVLTYAENNNNNQQNPTTANVNAQWFWGAPIHKRVNFVVRTAGYSTISGINVQSLRIPAAGTAGNSLIYFSDAVNLDKYIEPGQFYTLVATPNTAGPTATYINPTGTGITAVVSFFWRLDMTVASVAAGTRTNQGVVNWVAVGTQSLNSVTLRSKISSSQQIVVSLASTTFSVAAGVASQNWKWNVPAAQVQTDAGAYRYDYTAGVAGANPPSPCYTTIPSPYEFNITAGVVQDVFVLNSFGCNAGGNNLNLLVTNIAKTQSAITSGHATATLLADAAPATTAAPSVFFGAASTFNVPVALIATILSALLAALL